MTSHAKIWRAISIGAFVLCMLMPGYSAEGSNYYGWFLLLFGFCDLPSGEISWLANIALLLSWITLHRDVRFIPLAGAVVAIILALTFATKDTAWVYSWAHNYAAFSLQAGYYVWVASMVFAAVAALVNLTSKPASA
jgi:hypothetical protein